MTRRHLVYVAGPCDDEDDKTYMANVARAAWAGIELLKAGYAPVVPHTMTLAWYADPGVTREAILDADIALLRRCDAVLVVGNWESSEGTKREIEMAKSIGIPVAYSLCELRSIVG